MSQKPSRAGASWCSRRRDRPTAGRGPVARRSRSTGAGAPRSPGRPWPAARHPWRCALPHVRRSRGRGLGVERSSALASAGETAPSQSNPTRAARRPFLSGGDATAQPPPAHGESELQPAPWPTKHAAHAGSSQSMKPSQLLSIPSRQVVQSAGPPWSSCPSRSPGPSGIPRLAREESSAQSPPVSCPMSARLSVGSPQQKAPSRPRRSGSGSGRTPARGGWPGRPAGPPCLPVLPDGMSSVTASQGKLKSRSHSYSTTSSRTGGSVPETRWSG